MSNENLARRYKIDVKAARKSLQQALQILEDNQDYETCSDINLATAGNFAAQATKDLYLLSGKVRGLRQE